MFRVQRGVCDPNAVAWPSVVAIGVQTTRLPLSFAPGFVHGGREGASSDAWAIRSR